jgi:hypothetical protein
VTLLSSIIADAYRESNLIPIGKDPTTAQVTEGLRLLNALFSAVFGDEAGEALIDWPLGNSGSQTPDTSLTTQQRQHPNINRRLLATNEAAITVYLSPRPQDGSRMGIADPLGTLATYPVTINANGRMIEDVASLTINTVGLTREWFYRADLGEWVRITSKASTDEMPFPSDFDNFFIVYLALRLNPRYGRVIDAQSQMIFQSERKKFVARYLQSQPLEVLDDISWPFMSRQSYDRQRNFSSQTAFDQGYWGRG